MKRLRSIFLRARAERDLADELRAHIEFQTAENVRTGMSAEDARRAALIALGGVEQVKEESRAMRPGFVLETMWQDFRYAVRMLRKSPAFTIVAVLTLALGIGANTAIFSAVYGVLLRPLPYPQPEQLVTVQQTARGEQLILTPGGPSPQGGWPIPFSPPNWVDFRSQQHSFSSMGAIAATNFILSDNEPDRLPGANVSVGFFETMGVRPLLGRLLEAADEASGVQDVVLIREGLWKRRYGGEMSLIGRTITVNARPHVVVGIIPDGMRFPDDSEVWTPLRFAPGEMKERNSHYLDVVARLKPGITLAQAQAEMSAIAQSMGDQYPDSNRGFGALVMSLHEQTVGEVRAVLLALFGAVGFVMLIACANVASLLLARATGREKEIAMRAALGASRARLLRQLMTENVLLCVLGAGLGMIIANWGAEALRAFGPAELPRKGEILLDYRVMTFAAGIALLSALIFGLAPVVKELRVDLQNSLKEGARSTTGRLHHRSRAALVVAEVALSLVLLTGAGLMLRTMWSLVTTHPGIDPSNVLTADISVPRARYSLPDQKAAFCAQVIERIKVLPGVDSASATNNLPLSGSNFQFGFLIEGQPETEAGGKPYSAGFRTVTSDYLRTVRIPLLRGRGIEERDVAGAPDIVLINETMARQFWPKEDPLGHRIRVARAGEPAWREIVGVVGDVRHRALHIPPEPEMYVPYDQQPMQFIRLVVRTSGDRTQLAAALRQAVWSVDREQPVMRVQTLERIIAMSMAETSFYASLLGAFAALALALASVGVYGVLSYGVERRTHEIGVRVALGARPQDVLWLVLKQGVGLVAVGLAIGLMGAFNVTRFLKSLLHGVEATDPFTFAAVAVMMLVVALLACWIPARRALRVNPVTALRYE